MAGGNMDLFPMGEAVVLKADLDKARTADLSWKRGRRALIYRLPPIRPSIVHRAASKPAAPTEQGWGPGPLRPPPRKPAFLQGRRQR